MAIDNSADLQADLAKGFVVNHDRDSIFSDNLYMNVLFRAWGGYAYFMDEKFSFIDVQINFHAVFG